MSPLEDVRHGFRLLGRAPALTLMSILITATGVGAASVVYAAVKAVLIEPFRYSHPEALVQIRTDLGRGGNSRQDWVSHDDMEDVARENHSFTAIGAYHYALFNLGGPAGSLPEALYGLYVSASIFPTLGVRPMLGRNILPEETQPGREHEMILSYGLWVRRFRADPAVVGRIVQVNGHDCLIIGVMPAGFDFKMRLATTVGTPSGHMDFWAPLAVDPTEAHRDATGYGAIARLRPGTSLSQAQQDLAVIAARLARAYSRTNKDRTLHAGWLRDRTLGFAQTGLLLLMAAALVFLMIGCANLANLLLARALARDREMAIRHGVGSRPETDCSPVADGKLRAGRSWRARWLRAVRLGLEAAAGCNPHQYPPACHCSRGRAGIRFCDLGIGSHRYRRRSGARLESRGNGIVCVSGSRAVVGTSGNRARSLLLLSEIAVTLVLVVIGGALTGSLVRLLRTDPGFNTDHVLASIIVASGDRYLHHPEAQALLFRRILSALRVMPGVESAGAVSPLPFSGDNNGGLVTATEVGVIRPETQQIAEVDQVSDGYLETMGV